MKFFNKSSLIVLSFLLLSNIINARALNDEDLKVAAQLRDQAIESNTAWSILESLTTEVGPRMGGSKGDKIAVIWAEKKLKALGFDKVWKEPFTFASWHRGNENAEILSPFPQKLVITALGGSGSTPEGGLIADIVHFKTYQDMMKAEPSSIKNKIVFISNKMERFKNGSGYGVAVVARRNGAVEAGNLGAKAILIRSIGTDSHRIAHTGAMQMSDVYETIPAAALSSPDADMLLHQLERGQPVKLHLDITAHRGKTYTSYNVIAQINGSKYPENHVLIGGHLDSWDLGTGAIDDGAGVAITTAAAKMIMDGAPRPENSIRVVLWGSEEFGLIGAKAYRKKHLAELEHIIISSESDFGASTIYALNSRVNTRSLSIIAQMAGVLSSLDIQLTGNNGGGGPDLYPWNKDPMPFFRLAQDGTDYFDLHHTADDTLDKVDPVQLNQNVAAWTTVVYLAAQAGPEFSPKK
ncbi:MAG: M28 family peptidase [bacterium]